MTRWDLLTGRDFIIKEALELLRPVSKYNCRIGKKYPSPNFRKLIGIHPIKGPIYHQTTTFSFKGYKKGDPINLDVKPLPEGYPFKNVFLSYLLPLNENDLP